jgi:YD repeat-containing protein
MLTVPSTSALADDVLYPAEGISEGRAELSEAGALHQVNELSNRRRLTTFFINEQTPFYGVQLNYVNVGRGNLTFLNRDLVRLGRIPIVMGRVYDSQLAGQSDFGGGWKLSLVETIERDGGNLRYVDAGGSVHRLELDGMRIRSPYPHLTGIERGRRVGPLVELEVGDLIKRFKPIGNALYLDEVRNREGDHLRLEYAGTRVVRVTSNHGRFVAVERDSSGRILALEDDAGRTVGYEYDSAGWLVGVTDAGGRPWRLEYDPRGLLTSVEDPRESISLAATHGEDARVRSVRVLFDAMSFEYQGSSTTVRNALQQAATFWQAPSGLTTVAQDFAGSVTELSLSEQLRPVSLTFDGGLIAELGYQADGTLQTLTSLVTGAPEATELVYDVAGRLLSVLTEGETVAEYGYDARGRVTSAADTSGHRAYEYAGRDVRRLTINYSGLDLFTNGLGLLNGFRNEQQTVRLAYNDRDQLHRINFSQEGRQSQTVFEYGTAGLRTAATYTSGDGEAALTFGYDDVGNLTELFGVSADGRESGQTYILGDNNQLSILRNQERPDLVFEYDFAGRPTASLFDERRKDYRYDDLGRLEAVSEDGIQILQSSYGPMDVDAATEADGHTAFVAVEAPIASAIFGSLEEIAYARTRGTPYGPIRFNASMARFVLAEARVPSPDSVLLASFHRRSLPISAAAHGYAGHATEVVGPEPLGFDKPSNGLFLPAEFSSLNCFYCYAWGYAGNMYLTVNGTSSGTATAVVGQSASISLDESGLPSECAADYPGGSGYGKFFHYIDFGDGYYDNRETWGWEVETDTAHVYSAPGSGVIEDIIYCGCNYYPPELYMQFFGQVDRSLCVDTQYTPPPGPTVPAFTPVSLIDNGQTFGETDFDEGDSLVCRQMCNGEYRLEGDMTLSLQINIAQTLPSTGMCTATNRTSTNISRTQTHEVVHAEAFIDRINDVRGDWLGMVYGSASSCNQALLSARSILTSEMLSERIQQSLHDDHSGQPRYNIHCPTPGPTVEYQCGVGGPSCPGGDIY